MGWGGGCKRKTHQAELDRVRVDNVDFLLFHFLSSHLIGDLFWACCPTSAADAVTYQKKKKSAGDFISKRTNKNVPARIHLKANDARDVIIRGVLVVEDRDVHVVVQVRLLGLLVDKA